jgi:hypothetical protein
MSPEQVTGASDVDERSDIYSLGAVAYVMLTGREPFRGETAAATIYRRLVEDPVPPESLVPSVPAELSSIVKKCMSRDRSQRWPDARTLGEALERINAADKLPEVARDLPSFAPYAVLWVASWAGFAFLTVHQPNETFLLLLVALIVPAGLVFHLWSGAGRGMRFGELARVALWPPEWWGMWWPRSLRRPSDLWPRLPWYARALRIIISASCPALLLLILWGESWAAVAEWTLFAGCAIAVAAAFAVMRRKGLASDQSMRLLLGPSLASSSWKEPALDGLLLPVSGIVREPTPDVPSDHVRAIREMLALLPAAWHASGARVSSALKHVMSAIEAADRELAALARDAGPGEAHRLTAQLESLDDGNTRDTGERRELRDLVRHQLDLVHRMQSRREIVVRDRTHLLELLKALWVLVRSAGDSRAGSQPSPGKVDALCEEIERVTIRPIADAAGTFGPME